MPLEINSTGTRIRTQIKGFGDPYATVAPCPQLPLLYPNKYIKAVYYQELFKVQST